MTKGSVFAALAAAIAFFALSQAASAQYPPPKGSLVCTIDDVDLEVDSQVVVVVTLRDVWGDVVEGEGVSFWIDTSADIDISDDWEWTDGDGSAGVVVTIGEHGGLAVVHASVDDLECSVVVSVDVDVRVEQKVVVQKVFEPQVIVEERPQVVVIRPPNTGDGGLVGKGSDTPTAVYLALGAECALLAFAVALLVASHGRR